MGNVVQVPTTLIHEVGVEHRVAKSIEVMKQTGVKAKQHITHTGLAEHRQIHRDHVVHSEAAPIHHDVAYEAPAVGHALKTVHPTEILAGDEAHIVSTSTEQHHLYDAPVAQSRAAVYGSGASYGHAEPVMTYGTSHATGGVMTYGAGGATAAGSTYAGNTYGAGGATGAGMTYGAPVAAGAGMTYGATGAAGAGTGGVSLFNQYDTDGDGKISHFEFADRNHDGQLSRSEFGAARS